MTTFLINREVNITKFEKDTPNCSSTSFKPTPFTQALERNLEGSSKKQSKSTGPEIKELGDVTDLTVAGKATTPAVKSRSRKGRLLFPVIWDRMTRCILLLF